MSSRRDVEDIWPRLRVRHGRIGVWPGDPIHRIFVNLLTGDRHLGNLGYDRAALLDPERRLCIQTQRLGRKCFRRSRVGRNRVGGDRNFRLRVSRRAPRPEQGRDDGHGNHLSPRSASGAPRVPAWNAIYPFSHGGCWLINLFWCTFLIRKNGSGGQFLRLPGEGGRGLGFYYLMAMLSGAFWYFQFFFYGMGHLNLGEEFGFTSWAIHMSLLILFSNLYGFVFKEWEGASTMPKKVLHLGMLMIVGATLLITYGNYLGEEQTVPR